MEESLKSKEYYGKNRPEMLEFIPRSAQKILEVGCGEGEFSAQLTKKGMETWAIEPNKNASKNAAEKLFRVFEGTVAENISEIPDDYFDVIIMNDVIEHLLEPWDELKRLKAKLKKDGIFVSSIPNVRYAKNIFNLLIRKDWQYTEQGILDSTHLRFFTKKSIRRLFDESGYEVVNQKGLNRIKSWFYVPLSLVFNVPFFFTQLDVFYLQFGTVAKKKVDEQLH